MRQIQACGRASEMGMDSRTRFFVSMRREADAPRAMEATPQTIPQQQALFRRVNSVQNPFRVDALRESAPQVALPPCLHRASQGLKPTRMAGAFSDSGREAVKESLRVRQVSHPCDPSPRQLCKRRNRRALCPSDNAHRSANGRQGAPTDLSIYPSTR